MKQQQQQVNAVAVAVMVVVMTTVMMAGTASAAYDANLKWASGALDIFVDNSATSNGNTFILKSALRETTLNWDNDVAVENDANVRRCANSTVTAYVSPCADSTTTNNPNGDSCCLSDWDSPTTGSYTVQSGYTRCHYGANGDGCGSITGSVCAGFFEWDTTNSKWVLPAANDIKFTEVGQPAWATVAPEFYAAFHVAYDGFLTVWRSIGVDGDDPNMPPGICVNVKTREEPQACSSNQDCEPVFVPGADQCYFYNGTCNANGKCGGFDLLVDNECPSYCVQGNQIGVEICVENKAGNMVTLCKSNLNAVENTCTNNPGTVYMGECTTSGSMQSCEDYFNPLPSTGGLFGGAAATTGVTVAVAVGVMAALVVGSFMYGRRVQRRQQDSQAEMERSVELVA